jgi:hypothetical protein
MVILPGDECKGMLPVMWRIKIRRDFFVGSGLWQEADLNATTQRRRDASKRSLERRNRRKDRSVEIGNVTTKTTKKTKRKPGNNACLEH